MDVMQLMSKDPMTCSPNETLDCAAGIMWDKDCGIVPVIDSDRRVVGVITDRDICMAAYTQGKALKEIPIASIAMKQTVSVRPNDTLQAAENAMKTHQIRRIVVTDDQNRLVGLLSLNDLARHTGRKANGITSDEVTRTLAGICEPRDMRRERNATA